ncbi:MATE family efflux transporter [Streptomyces sp. NPDC059918]|uniref:MATE family efflux transporter n=1 Tax=unclassified Streptomyces TaxID=2593676 RepID=UPI003651BBC1
MAGPHPPRHLRRHQIAAAAARAEKHTGNDQDQSATGTAVSGEGSSSAHEEVRAIVRASLAMATLAGAVGAVLMVLIGQALSWLGQDPAVVDLTRTMLYALAPGLLPCLWFQAIRQFTVGMRRPQALLQITIASVAVNAGLNWILVHGTFGLPQLGLTGIGTATSSVYLLTFLALYASAKKDQELAPLLSLDITKADPVVVKRLIGLGIPIAATYGSEAGFFSLTALMAGSFGPDALAAHTAVNQLVYIVFQVAVGLSHAASINVSRELALGHHDDARRIKNTVLACAAAVMTVVGVLYVTIPDLVLAGCSRTRSDSTPSASGSASSPASPPRRSSSCAATPTPWDNAKPPQPCPPPPDTPHITAEPTPGPRTRAGMAGHHAGYDYGSRTEEDADGRVGSARSRPRAAFAGDSEETACCSRPGGRSSRAAPTGSK